MDDVMSPAPLDPLRAMQEAITSLEEQVKARVTSVENGRKFQQSGRGDASMPDGAAIFETTGAWEDFATPARDLDRKSTRLNSSHLGISYAVFCLKKKKKNNTKNV